MRAFFLMLAGLAFFVGVSRAEAFTSIDIDLSTQRMNVVSSQGTYSWPISSARAGYFTPTGSYAPQHLEAMHYSRLYDDSPMPHSIFFRGGFAIHGTYETRALGHPASHGCIRLAPGNAAILYRLIQSEGGHIVIHGAPPVSARAVYASRRVKHGAREYARAHVTNEERAYYGYAAPIEVTPPPVADPYAGLF